MDLKSGCSCFSQCVVGENPLYTSTTIRLCGRFYFGFSVWVGLQAGCGDFFKQTITFDSVDIGEGGLFGAATLLFWQLWLHPVMRKNFPYTAFNCANNQFSDIFSGISFCICLLPLKSFLLLFNAEVFDGVLLKVRQGNVGVNNGDGDVVSFEFLVLRLS